MIYGALRKLLVQLHKAGGAPAADSRRRSPFRQLLCHAGLHQTALVGAHHQLGAVVRIELGHDAREVRFDRCGADEQALADLVVVQAARSWWCAPTRADW